MTVHTGYWPADRDHEISGDFYDVFRVDDRRWAVAIGDVCGHGVDAAALTGLTRHTIRAAARHLRSPAEVLRWTHEALAAESGTTYVTVCFAFIDVRDDDTFEMRVSLGGHPRPALWHAGTVRFVGTPGTLLGLVEPTLSSEAVTLEAGDVLVLYTDGVTDAAEAPLDEAALGDVIAATLHDHDVDDAPEALRAEVRRRRPGGSDDDSAVLLIHAVGGGRRDVGREPVDVAASG
jgi:serine phosphatase RsbU (regulator of sigma subunit)